MKISLTINTLQRILKAIGNNGNLNQGNLAKKLNLPQPGVSARLKEIRKLKVFNVEYVDNSGRGGIQKIYSLNKKGKELLKLLGD